MKKSKLKDYLKESFEYRKIVFFSEGINYWSTFAPVINSLIKKNIKFSFLTMDANDPGLKFENENIKKYYIGTGFNSMFFMNMLEADIVVMTTPGLGSLNIKRSPGVKHYTHIVHSPADIHTYRKFSFDHFDSVMCSGPHQMKSLRELEDKRKSNKKLLLETGCSYMDILAENTELGVDNGNTILVAPTWGSNGALSKYGSSIIKPLLDSGYDVIVRPHPQQYKSEVKLLKQIQKELKKYNNLAWDNKPTGKDSLRNSTLMISDLSGVIFDYAFIYNKPVISLDYTLIPKGFELEDLSHNPWEIDVREDLGALYSGDGSSISEVVKKVLEENNRSDDSNCLRDNSVYNWKNSGAVAADQLITLLEKQ